MKERFVLKNEAAELPLFRERIRTLLAKLKWSEQQIGEWVLVLDEALTNVIRHSYGQNSGEIIVEIIDVETQTEFFIEDHGTPFDPTKVPTPELPKDTPGGLGVHLIRSLTDCFEYDTSFRGGNRIRLARHKVREKRSHL